MNKIFSLISYLGLVLTLGPPILVLAAELPIPTSNLLMAIGMGIWFVARVVLMVRQGPEKPPELVEEHNVDPFQ